MDTDRVNVLARKQYIESWVDKIYDENNHKELNYLFPEPINQFKQYALDMFLDTSLSYQQIDENMSALIIERKKAYDQKMALIKREQDIRNAVQKMYMGNEKAFNKNLTDLQKEYLELYLNNSSISIEDIEGFLLRTIQEYAKVQTTNLEIADANPIITEVNPVEVSISEEPIVNNGLDTMINDTANEEAKIDVSNKKQVGAISLFSICVSILAIAAFVLVAMILNLLLK